MTCVKSMGLVLLLPSLAWANAAGLPGYSGKQGPGCGMCHGGGAAGTAAVLAGPATVEAGTTNTYRVTATATGYATAGVGVATDSGQVVFGAGQNTKLMASEVVQPSLVPMIGGNASFAFTVTAPSSPGSYTLYSSVAVADSNGSINGDGAAEATLKVTVTAAAGGGGGGGGGGGADAGSDGPPGVKGLPLAQGELGCTSVTGTPWVVLAALAGLGRRRRRAC